ncbi:nucleotidyltransferase [Thermobifida halotolerans]|uniref:Nucleotidyltransferase n=1 Tax=Thermobifida halotolerans TaxID=483545 RepID=A0A399G5Q6_9ACTN|nr:DUF6504 family protein [Thermobifida halotolerans]UOE17937.1 nucleotidyltransferase [Thermobifida halotolerans]
MTGRVYGVPVQVWEHDGRPTRFVWQGRLHVVRQILDHWVTVRSDISSGDGRRPPERTFWRVRAGAGADSGLYELRHDSTTGTWLLARVTM